MSPNVTIWMLAVLVGQASPTTPDAACGAAARAVLSRAAADVERGDFVTAAEGLHGAYDAPDTAGCRPIRLAAWAWRGWASAARAAAVGGTPESLVDVTAAVTAVSAFGPARSEAAYAAAVLRAAAAAAQDERDEMQVWLEEARAVAARLALVGGEARWPLPIDLAEGALWHDVDDFELAAAAYTRALAGRETPVAWRGLARARDRRGDRRGACDAYRHVQSLLSATAQAGPLAAEARGYLLICTP